VGKTVSYAENWRFQGLFLGGFRGLQFAPTFVQNPVFLEVDYAWRIAD
jgi:hypothetical protein